MQIDLLISKDKELGLLADSEFSSAINAVIFDVEARALTLEFGEDLDAMPLNVPVGEEFVEPLKSAAFLHICVVAKGRMLQATQAPLMKVSISDDDDFYYGEMRQGIAPVQMWVESARYGQPIHRDNLSIESSAKGVVPGLLGATLRVAPQLAQALAQEQALVRQQAMHLAPGMTPPSLGPGSRMATPNLASRSPRPPSSNESEG